MVQIEEASSKISDLLDVVLSYIDKVLATSECNAAENSHIGRMLLDLMTSVPHVSPERFEEMFNSNVKVKIIHFFDTLLIKINVYIYYILKDIYFNIILLFFRIY